jgi:arginyl-tRNA synthetase
MKNRFLNNLLAKWKDFASQNGVIWKNSFLQWDLPENVTADFALTLALPISHKNQKTPSEIATEIVRLNDYPGLEWNISEKGYINFRLPLSYYQQFLSKTWQEKGQNLRGSEKNLRVVNLEYVSTNPTGKLHLAHFRHAFLGNTLANIYQFCGYEAVREYYINDRGGQITSLVGSVYYFYHKLQNISPSEPTNNDYSNKNTEEIAAKLIKKWGSKYLNVSLDKELFFIWKKEILEMVLTDIRHDLEKCGVKFDNWFSETSLYEENKHSSLLQELEKKNLIYQQEGTTFFRSGLGGDEKDRVIIKKDGDYTYFFSDILYHLNKLKRSEQIINIWGADHHGFIARLKSACQLLGYQAETIQIILVQMVNLLTPEGDTKKFSKRSGNTINLEEALKYLKIDQLKFYLLEKESNRPLAINTELLKENQEKTRLYYLQYAHARCQQLINKAQEKNLDKISFQIDLLGKKERKLLNLLIRFPNILEKITEENKPHYLIHYLDELAHSWQVYYQNSIILDEKNPELSSQKLLVVKNIQIILKLGLILLGIEAPEWM